MAYQNQLFPDTDSTKKEWMATHFQHGCIAWEHLRNIKKKKGCVVFYGSVNWQCKHAFPTESNLKV